MQKMLDKATVLLTFVSKGIQIYEFSLTQFSCNRNNQ